MKGCGFVRFIVKSINKLIIISAFLGIGVCFANLQVIPASPAATTPHILHPTSPAATTSNILYPTSSSSNPVGTIPGKLNISPSGAATYSIPIDAPPGTDGMKPEISITYNSQHQNGLLGMGFSLSGLTAITRVSQNKAQNGKIHGVDFTNDDRFSLDGDQLVATNGATYGADGAIYHLYETDFAKIESIGQQGNGPAKFKVWTKGGEIAEYGFTDDSQVKASGKDTVSEWALNKIQDHSGNYLNITYYEDEDAGIHYPKEINYTGNDNAKVAPYNKIEFYYEDRPDTQTSYEAGSNITLNKRLEEIKVLTDGNLTYDYHFNYEQSPNSSRSRLVSVQKCDSAGECLKPTKFTWQDKQTGWELSDKTLPVNTVYVTSLIQPLGTLVDMNGDGSLDLTRSYQSKENSIDRDLNNDNRTFLNKNFDWQPNDQYKLPDFSAIAKIWFTASYLRHYGFLVDVNGNGLPDYVLGILIMPGFSDSYGEVWLNTGSGFEKANYTSPFPYASPSFFMGSGPYDSSNQFVDLTGDGRTDYVLSSYQVRRNDHLENNEAWINNGNGWDQTDDYVLPEYMDHLLAHSAPTYRGHFANIGDDELIDYIYSYYDTDTNKYAAQNVYLNPGSNAEHKWKKTNYQFPIPINGEHYNGQNNDMSARLVDLNGDGLTDYVFSYENSDGTEIEYAWVNTGDGWVLNDDYKLPRPFVHIKKDESSQRRGYFVDVNGDGMQDYVYLYYNSAEDHAEEVWLNTGHGWSKSSYTAPIEPCQEDYPILNYEGRFVDINGDGLSDYVYAYVGGHTDSRKGIYLSNGKVPDYLIGVTDGLEVKTSITYKPLTNNDVYTKEHDATYPNYDLQKPIYVVYQTSSDADINDPEVLQRILLKKGISQNYRSYLDSNEQHVTTYHYTGAKENHLGFGFLGFHQVTKTDQSTGISETTTYSQNTEDHTYEKALTKNIYSKENKLISSTENNWKTVKYGDGSLNNTYYYLYTDKVINKHYSLAGAWLSTQTTDTVMDDYGNPIKLTDTIHNEITNETNVTQTLNTYENDPTNWLLGALTAATVAHASSSTAKAAIKASSFTYGANGVLQQTVVEPNEDQYKLTTTYKRDDFGNIIKTTISGKGTNDRVININYDPTGRFVTSETNALEQTMSEVIDHRFGKATQTTDLNGIKINFEYDGFGQLTKEIRPDGVQATSQHIWNDDPQVPDAKYYVQTKTTGSSDEQIAPITTVYYDKLNRAVAESTQSLDGTLIWKTKKYDELGRITKESLPYYQGGTPYYTQFQFDELGRVTKIIHPNGKESTTDYNGYTTTATNQLNQKTTKTINARGKVAESIDYHDDKEIPTSFKYDAIGNLIQVTDSAGNNTIITYDKLGRKTSIDDPDKGKWTYDYNQFGELISQSNAKGQTTTFIYDLLGRMTSRTDPAGTSAWEYGNDKTKHNVGKLIHVNGISGLNGKKPSSSQLIQAAKDGLINYSKIISYNDLSLPQIVITTIDGTQYMTITEYDKYSRPEIITYPENQQLMTMNVYNELGYLTDVCKTDPNKSTLKNYWHLNTMDAQGHVTSFTRSNGMITKKTYDPKTEFLTEIKTTQSQALRLQQKLFPITKNKKTNANINIGNMKSWNDDTVIQDLQYQYDSIGNVKSRSDDVNMIAEGFNYDDLNRITKWTENTKEKRNYQYDNLGNITYKSDLGYYNYGKTNAGPHAVTSITDGNENQIATFKYNENGDQTDAIINDEPRQTNYTSYNKPLAIVTNNAVVIFYYNADRTRFERVDTDRKTNTVTTTLYLGNYILVNHNKNGVITTEQKYYVSPNTLVTLKDDGSSNIYELLTDNLGSTTAIADQNGNMVQRFHYTPFGEQEKLTSAVIQSKKPQINTSTVIPAKAGIHIPENQESKTRNQGVPQSTAATTSSDSFPITHSGFTGQEEVESVNLIHMNGRIYDPVVGRFLSADPFVQMPENSQDLNRYSYCLNNPLAFTDSSGYFLDGFFGSIGDLFSNELFTSIASIIIGAVAYSNPITAVGFSAWMTSAMATSAFSGVISLVNGGDVEGVITAVAVNFGTACVWSGTGGFLEGIGAGVQSGNWGTRGIVHGIVGGGLAEVQGGNFVDGFIANATSQGVTTYFPMEGIDEMVGTVAARTTTAAIVGGTASALAGGDFANGAKTAAYAQLYNCLDPLFANMASGNRQQQEIALTTAEDMLALGPEALSSAGQYAYSYLINHGDLAFNGTTLVPTPIPLPLIVNADISTNKSGVYGFLGFGLGLGEKYSVKMGPGMHFGHEAKGFTVKAFVGGSYRKFGGDIAGSVSQNGSGLSVYPNYGNGAAGGIVAGYTGQLINFNR